MGGGLESRCVPCGWCRATVPDDGRMYPKHVELRIYQ